MNIKSEIKLCIIIISLIFINCNPFSLLGWKPPLHQAALDDDIEKMKILIEMGANVNEKYNSSIAFCGRTPLEYAVTNGSYRAVKLLLKHRANVNEKNTNGDTPLHLAAGYTSYYPCKPRLTRPGDGSNEVAKILIENGADLNAKNYDGFQPIHNASMNGRLDIIKLLIEHEVDVNSGINECGTPFLLCGYYDSEFGIDGKRTIEIAKYLLKKGAKKYVKDKDGWTPLHMAASWGNYEHVKFLINIGLKINIQDKNGNTPLHLSTNSCDYQTINFLIKSGANRNLKNNNGKTSFDIASTLEKCRDNYKVLELLKN